MTETKTAGFADKLLSGAIAGVVGTTMVIETEGFRGLYRGLSANLIGVTPEKAIKLAVNDYSRAYFGQRIGTLPDNLPARYGMASGAIAGFCQVIATNPMEITKIQMQLAVKEGEKVRLIEVVKRLGLRGLYQGTLATLCRDIPFSIMFFQTFAYLKAALSRNSNTTSPPFTAILSAGMVAGGAAAFFATPMDGI